MDSSTVAMLAALAALIALSAYFSATETAFTSLNRIRLKTRADDGDKRAARTLALAADYDRLLSTLLIGNTIVNNVATTIGAVLTNARLTKTELNKIASMAHNGDARSIRPLHTTADGDSIYALSTGDVEADLDMVGTLGAQVMSEAILRAVRSATSGYGFPALRDLPWSH